MPRPVTAPDPARARAAQLAGRAAATALRRPGGDAVSDLVALEEPLEIRIAGETVGVLMRTPGDDHRLALGYLFSEGIVSSASEFSAVYHCGRPGEEAYGSAIELAPASGARIDWERIEGTRRASASSSACGVCGRRAVEDLVAGLVPPEPIAPVPAALLAEKVEALRDHQPVFAATGGAHVAALWAQDGSLVAAHEDVGRHNAVDKVVGALLLARAEAAAGAPELRPALLTVSSRAGFEIVQKAARARVPIVATVSAPTSLAVELARAAGLTLAGFVRPGRMNVYAGAERLIGL
ncbi:formate dehydrogenase accessory sulfurtransferase FdhD [Anaeromyxobacter sp. Fw109-5]|uniref:formate dehydrogenase accessory sulfurtransferase FdhD n=1 Tax=Anaeromyxobacter sp. (strain Fw109-5) TaxID=404589 RepID=UPI0000ED8A1A|nr:formate dehydrogenase family accessory protein FdhD [Anaeromyxobacter sp. Fw109-5]